ncbi:MAG: TetR/AcrR family transcriptional regulator [Gammaproteobacteria bacterium]|nr:TetR/AcrR family transcriptional regulator [Gammaproteobacteria bacterium]
MPRLELTEAELNQGRQQILDAAMKLFSEQGYKGVTARSIAKVLGWSSMKAYRYYENKLAIFVAVREVAFFDLTTAMKESADVVSHPLDKIYASGYAYIKFALDNLHEYNLCFEVDQGEMAEYQLMSDVAMSPWDLALKNFQEAKQAGYMAGDMVLATHLTWIGLHGLATLKLAERLNFDRSIDALVDPVIDIVLARFSTGKDKIPSRTKRRSFKKFG